MSSGHVVSMYVATSGASGPMLGSDEKEVILLVYAVIDTATNKVIGVQQYLVRPVGEFGPAAAAISASAAGADQRDTSSPTQSTTASAGPVEANTGSTSPAGSPNHTVATVVTSPSTQPEHTITEAMIKVAGRPLGEVIEQFDQYLRTTLAIDPEDGTTFRLVTDGPLPLRQSLHPEACTKNLQLPAYYCRYNDLRKEFVRFKSADLSRALVAVKDASKLHTMPTLPATPASIAEMMQQLDIQSFQEADPNFYAKDSRDMITLIQAMIAAGHQFDAVEQIHLTLEPGLCSIDDEIDGQCIVRARGLPWQSSDQDIANFFRGLNVAKGGVALCLSVQGRRNGEAMVRFTTQEHRDMALKRHKHHIGNRYIEVYRASGEDFLNVAGGASNEAQTFLSRGAQVIIRMRGLPYDCTAKQVLEFFANGNDPCTVLDAAEGILFVKKPDGRATGDAFVLFANETDAPKALSRHRESIGQRYIELFRSTPAEVQQVLNRSLDPKTYEPPQPPLIAQLPPVQIPLLPQHVITSGTSKSCIRLRGLPYEARVEHILHFLEDFANNIIYQGVHMVYNAQGQPSGEAFIQMDSEDAARASAQLKHNKYMVFGKKYRYIEVFQCSGDDMNLVLNGGLHSPANATKPALLSPGGTMVGPAFSGYAPFGQPGPVMPPPPRGHHLSPAYYPQPILYWGYPSPPVSPTAYYGQPPAPHNGHPQVHGHHPHLHHGMAHHQPALPPPQLPHSQPQQQHPHHQQQQPPPFHHHPHQHQQQLAQQYRTPRRPLQYLSPPHHPIQASAQSPQLSPMLANASAPNAPAALTLSPHPTYHPPVVTLGYTPSTEPPSPAITVISHDTPPHDSPPAAHHQLPTISPLPAPPPPQPAAPSTVVVVKSTILDQLPATTAAPSCSHPTPTVATMPGASSPAARLVRSASSAASVGRPPAAVVTSNQYVEMFSV